MILNTFPSLKSSKLNLLLAACIMAPNLLGCVYNANAEVVDYNQFSSLELTPNEKIGLYVSEYKYCYFEKELQCSFEKVEEFRKPFEACLINGLLYSLNREQLIMYNPNQSYNKTDHLNRLKDFKIKYLVEIKIIFMEGRPQVSSENLDAGSFNGTPIPAFLLGSNWSKSSSLHATISDVADGKDSLNFTVQAVGTRGGGAAIIGIIPIPFGYNSRTDASACKLMGEKLGVKLLGNSI